MRPEVAKAAAQSCVHQHSPSNSPHSSPYFHSWETIELNSQGKPCTMPKKMSRIWSMIEQAELMNSLQQLSVTQFDDPIQFDEFPVFLTLFEIQISSSICNERSKIVQNFPQHISFLNYSLSFKKSSLFLEYIPFSNTVES